MPLLYAHIGSLNSASIALHWICCLPTSPSLLQAFYGRGHLRWMLFYLHQRNIKAKTNICVCVCVCVHSVAQSCRTLCLLKDCSPPGSSVHGILQARILEWVPCSPPGDLPDPWIFTTHVTSISSIGWWILYHWATWEAPSICVPNVEMSEWFLIFACIKMAIPSSTTLFYWIQQPMHRTNDLSSNV